MKGTYQRGVIHLDEPLPLPDGAEVDVAVVATERGQGQLREMDENSWDVLTQLLADCAIDTDIADLASQHDYYLYGIPKTVRDADRTNTDHPVVLR